MRFRCQRNSMRVRASADILYFAQTLTAAASKRINDVVVVMTFANQARNHIKTCISTLCCIEEVMPDDSPHALLPLARHFHVQNTQWKYVKWICWMSIVHTRGDSTMDGTMFTLLSNNYRNRFFSLVSSHPFFYDDIVIIFASKRIYTHFMKRQAAAAAMAHAQWQKICAWLALLL